MAGANGDHSVYARNQYWSGSNGIADYIQNATNAPGTLATWQADGWTSSGNSNFDYNSTVAQPSWSNPPQGDFN